MRWRSRFCSWLVQWVPKQARCRTLLLPTCLSASAYINAVQSGLVFSNLHPSGETVRLQLATTVKLQITKLPILCIRSPLAF